MKALLLLITLPAAGAAAWLTMRTDAPAPPSNPGSALTAVPASEPAVGPVFAAKPAEAAASTKMDAPEIFRRAFWRRPDAADKILHAERREREKNAQGISTSQWFVAVEPGPGLTKWLREENAFGVRPAKSAIVSNAPSWFPADTTGYTVFTGGMSGGLVFLYGRDGKTLYAAGSGKGFTPGAPEPAAPAPVSTAISTGRLPQTPPPAPHAP